MEEIFDIYTREGEYIGTKEESICHSKNAGFYHNQFGFGLLIVKMKYWFKKEVMI